MPKKTNKADLTQKDIAPLKKKIVRLESQLALTNKRIDAALIRIETLENTADAAAALDDDDSDDNDIDDLPSGDED